MRFAFVVLAALMSQAPLQCGSDQDPSLRRYETPAEALYGLAQQFKAQNNQRAYRDTLEYLVARYPNSRHAVMAREDLEALGESDSKQVSGSP